MAEYDIPFAALRYRYTPLALARRNVRICGGDDLTLTVTVYDDEDSGALSDVSLSTPVLYLYPTHSLIGSLWDYGFGWASLGARLDRPILSIGGFVPTAPSTGINLVFDFVRQNYLAPGPGLQGQIVFSFQPWQTINLHGRFAFAVFLATAAGLGQTILRGIIDIDRGVVTPWSANPFILGTDVLGGPDVLT